MLTVDSMWNAGIPDNTIADYEPRVIFVPISFTNREPSRRVSVEFDLLWSRSVKGQVVGSVSDAAAYASEHPRCADYPSRC